ncbi:hypothetical protein DAI22_08g242800 [Oryza sativa Japonica Group]|nr:hypothetical protein DAI22_08g242800 [Oryza sativa Japonica Group]
MFDSNTCNCSSWQKSALFLNVLETRDHLLELGIASCLERRWNEVSSIKIAISLASANSLTTLQLSRSTEEDFLLIFLNCFCAFLIRQI